MNFLAQFPDRKTLLDSSRSEESGLPLKINNHIHTPYSFSAFESVNEIMELAGKEEIRVLGINDFYVTDGYAEFQEKCVAHGIFPLFNIELIGISREHQEKGIRINDPNNPGRIYISGKGLAYPSILPDKLQGELNGIIRESNKQVSAMIDLLNRWMQFQQVEIRLSVEEIMENHARQLLRERHVAKALRVKIEQKAENDDAYGALIRQIYGGKSSEKKRDDIAGVEEELRARLLKANAPAFVAEDEKAFLGMERIVEIIRAAGGIPTYPMLLDGAGGEMTPFEDGKEQLYESLSAWGFTSVELIPLRNRIDLLKAYAAFFYNKGFVVSFGTEHNTSAMRPLTVNCKDQTPLDKELEQISFLGAAYQAAHQYLVSREGPANRRESRSEMEKLGRAVFNHYFQQY